MLMLRDVKKPDNSVPCQNGLHDKLEQVADTIITEHGDFND